MASNRRLANFNFEALGNYVVVERDEAEKVTPGGIIIPEVAEETPEQGYILSIGEKVEAAGILHVGDRVLIPAIGQRAVELGGKKVVLMLDEEVMVRMV